MGKKVARHPLFGTTYALSKAPSEDALEDEYYGNLSRAWLDTTPQEKQAGRHWYDEATAHAKTKAVEHNTNPKHPISEQDSFDVLALLNTHNSWKGSVTEHENILRAKREGKPFPYALPKPGQKGNDSYVKINRMLWGGEDREQFFTDSSPKITPFRNALGGRRDQLVLDVWGNRTTTGGRKDTLLEGERNAAVRAWGHLMSDIQNTGDEDSDMNVADIQAALWTREQQRTKTHLIFNSVKGEK